jgi:hemolysin-activating ACP:hemolysin acyltransferase
MRHFAELRAAGPEAADSDRPFPADWFDLPEGLFADLGSMVYLAGMTRYHRPRAMGDMLSLLEPPLRLGQYRLFRSNGFPRAFITWAGLGPEQERRFAVEHQGLRPEDWNSGASVWLVDFVAPFGHIDQIVPMLSANPDLPHVRTLWHNRDGSRYRVVEWSRARPEAEVEVRSYGAGQFARLLMGGEG